MNELSGGRGSIPALHFMQRYSTRMQLCSGSKDDNSKDDSLTVSE